MSLWEDANHGYPFVYFSSVALAAAVTSLVVAAPLVAWLGPRPAERPTGRGLELLVLAGASAARCCSSTPAPRSTPCSPSRS